MPLEICGCGGRMCFYQWDKGRKLQDREMSLGSTSQAHFTNSVTGEVLATDFYNDGGVMRCTVPDELLQVATPLDVMVYTTNEHGDYTETHVKFMVKARKMPPDYTYQTATEAVKEHNETILALTGTDHSTAVGAVAEINETISTNLVEKGVDAVASETTEVLAGKIAEIPNPQDSYNEGVAEGVQSVNTDVLSITGTEQPTAVEAVTEVNATLATNLSDKGVEADATETTESLVGKVGDIKDPQDAYDEGYNVGFADGKASASWIEEWARQCTKTGTLSDAEITEIGDLNFENAIEVTQGLFENNTNITKVGDITAPLEKGYYGAGGMFKGCSNLVEVGNITLNGGGNNPYGTGLFQNCGSLQTAGLVRMPLYRGISNIAINCVSLVTFGGIDGGDWISAYSAFNGCKKLREITHPIDFTSATDAGEMFRSCIELEEVRFVAGTINCDFGSFGPVSCPKLSNASIQSFVDGLKDRTGETTFTIKFHADVKSKLTETQIATITGKNWTIA